MQKDDDDETVTPTPTSTLYERLGSINAISAVTDQFLANVVADPVINARFAATIADANRTRLLRLNLIDQICAAAAGPCQYKGKTMIEAHQGLNITEVEFNALVGDLVDAMTSLGVAQADQNELLGILGGLKPDIVGQ
ncbi:MAG TPA: group 1 truncated hemoglobin [Bacteroidia bacterium]|nr:group 1 truncated hemoglobin [Bacteroidia bacterium]HNU33258.1 group 1 truncated hemoglobin [Bacteroidia bacterium]